MNKSLFLNALTLVTILLCTFTASAYDFEVDEICYNITSPTTVLVKGHNWNPWNDIYNIEIPSQVSYNNVDYTVTAIGDSAFYYEAASTYDYFPVNYNITIPETVSYIGYDAFVSNLGMINIICFAKIPPIISGFSCDSNGILNLFVGEETYTLYQEMNNQNHLFDSVYITNGEKSTPPRYNECLLEQPFGGVYGCAVSIYPSNASLIYSRIVVNETTLQWNLVYTDGWEICDNLDSLYFYYESICDGTSRPNGWMVEFFAIEEGKNPSPIICCGGLGLSNDQSDILDGFDYKWWETFDFIDSDISYIIGDDDAVVTFQGYDEPCVWHSKKSASKDELSSVLDSSKSNAKWGDWQYESTDEIIYYFGDVVIPSTATYHNYQNDSYTTYPVVGIGHDAFKNCVNLTGITIPNSITSIGVDAFEGCTSLTRVNISDIEAWCNIHFEVEEHHLSNPLLFAHHLYLNGHEVKDLIIPNTVDIISCAFEGCRGLTSVTIPSSVTDIENNAFKGCHNLTYIKCLGSNPAGIDEIYDNSDPFDDIVYQTATLFVPINAIDSYKTAEGWKKFKNIVGFYDYDFVVDGIYYRVTGTNEVEVSAGEEAYHDSVIIPSFVNYQGVTYSVKGIGSHAFLNATLSDLILPVTLDSGICDDAFEECSSELVYLIGEGEWQGGALPGGVKTLYIGSGVTGVKGMQVNPETIYSYATTPPICDEYSFTGYDGELHVPASSLAAYFTAPYWCNFTNIIGDAVALTDLTLSQDSIELLVGAEATLRTTLTPANAAPANIVWKSSDTTVTVVEDGVVRALKTGGCDIIAICQDKRAVCHVTVTEILPTSVTLNQETAKIEVGTQLTLTVTVLPEDATDKTVLWSSSNNSVATVDENGVVTGVGQGECDITAWCHGKSAQCHVIVVEHLIYISLDQHEASVLPNHIITLTPTVAPVSTDLVVTSSNPEVAAARLAGNKIQVVGIKEGTATIVVNSADGYAEPDSCVVRVYTERGDVNSDGFVDINDVTVLIDYLLGTSPQSFSSENADTNNDGDVDINDVTMLIDYLLGAVELQPKDEYTQEFTVNGVTFTMVRVEGGTFTMGATEEEDSDYQVFKGSPQHQVTLSGFCIGQTEVTQELWQAVMSSNPSHDTSDLQYPVDGVSWNDCAEFITQLNQLTGMQFRLPTEAEWEYAAKGGSKSLGYVYSGSDDLDEVAWTNANSDGCSHQVATKKANELGLYDMNGNIEEWCNDWYSLYTEDPLVNPTGPETGTSRMHRGGRWTSGSKFCRLTRRDGFAPTVTRNYLGLRLAL